MNSLMVCEQEKQTINCFHLSGKGLAEREGSVQIGTPTNAKIAALLQEMDSIHVANTSYWRQPEEGRNRAERAEYQRRQNRLQEIRAERALLHSTRRDLWSCVPKEDTSLD